MALNEDGKFCRNCQRKIPTSNFEVHTAHCQRSILLCPKCREPIHRSEMEEHNQEYHIKVSCEKCGSEMEKSEISHHQNEICCRRSVKCPFCEIEYLFSNLKEHEEYCGSRTEHCAVCDQYVMLKHLDSHLASNHSVLSPEKKKPLVVGENEEHNNNSGRIPQTANTRVLPSVNSIKLKKVPNIIQHTIPLRTSPSKRTNDMPQINTDASDNQLKDTGKIALHDLDELIALHLVEEDLHKIPSDVFSQLVEEFPLENRTSGIISSRDFEHYLPDDFDTKTVPHYSDETVMDDDILPCEFCGDLFPAAYLIQHQSGCRPDVAHGTPSELNNFRPVDSISSVADAILTSDSSEFLNNLILNRSISPPRDILGDEECLLPCEFCGIQFPIDMLIMHQSGCRQDIFLGTSAELNNLHQLDTTSSSSDTVHSLNEEQEKHSLNNSSTGNVAPSIKDTILSNAVNSSVGKANSSQYETPPNRRLNESSATNKPVYSEQPKVNEIPYHSSKEYKFSKDKDPLSNNVDSKKTKISTVRETISKEWKADVLSSYNKRGVGTNNYKSHRLEGDAPRSYSTISVNKTLRGLNTENIAGTRPKNQTSSSANRLLKRSDIQSRYPLYHSQLSNEPPISTNLSSPRVFKYEPRSGLAKHLTSDTWSSSTARSTFSWDKSGEDTQSYRLHDNRLPFRSIHAQQSESPRPVVLPRIPNTGAVPKQKGKQAGQKSKDTFS